MKDMLVKGQISDTFLLDCRMDVFEERERVGVAGAEYDRVNIGLSFPVFKPRCALGHIQGCEGWVVVYVGLVGVVG